MSMLYVIKRNGQPERMQFDKITARLDALMWDLDTEHVFPELVAQKVVAGIKSGMKTSQIDEEAAETAGNMTFRHPDYGVLAARILVSNLHKQTPSTFSEAMEELHKSAKSTFVASEEEAVEEPSPYFAEEFIQQVRKHRHILDAAIEHKRDFDYDYFGIQTFLKNGYSTLNLDRKRLERPQYMWMRVALALNFYNVEGTLLTYRALSANQYTHGTPTLTGAGQRDGQLCSCFLLQLHQDSIECIYDTLKKCALISKASGGLGLSIHNIRETGALIASTRGQSNGLIPMTRVYNCTARYVNQGGRRPGSNAMYLEVWHPDVWTFLDMRKNTGIEEQRCRDLFTALWMCDLFMERVEADAEWSFFSPRTTPGLNQCYGEKFRQLYTKYERQGRAVKVIKARELWVAILASQQETGTPYILFKDACNEKNNQKNLGTLQGSNLCAEILEYTSAEEVAVCNLASLNLAAFVVKGAHKDEGPRYDFDTLHRIAKLAARNLDRVIDVTHYPIPEAKLSNERHRPIGLGVQGLADAFILMRMPYESKEAQQLNRDIFETIYHAAMETSYELACEFGPYSSFAGSPLSKGKFQFDMWGVAPSARYDWESLRKNIMKVGTRNSLVVALMPTASTSNLLGQNEAFEPYTSNLYVRRTQAGEFVLLNKHMVRDLQALKLWNTDMINHLVASGGSIQHLTHIPADIRELYKTVWEISLKIQIDMSADRAAFVCQTQSFNAHMRDVTMEKQTKMLFYAWKKGLKTGMYYLRQFIKPSIQFNVDRGFQVAKEKDDSKEPAPGPGEPDDFSIDGPVCSRESGCTSCQG